MSDLSTLDRLSTLDTNSVSDALDFLKVKGATYGLRPLWDCPKVVGRASTVKVDRKSDSNTTAHPFSSVIDAVTTDDRILIISGGIEGVSCWGDIIANASKLKGIRGTVIDGMCRDIDGSREASYPVYGRGVTMISGRNRLVQIESGTAIQIQGVIVCQDDYVIADNCGTVFIPAKFIEDVLKLAEKIAKRESLMIEEIRAGKLVSEVMDDARFEAMRDEISAVAAAATAQV